jgi:membrane protease YdiL (CAAX protease family)
VTNAGIDGPGRSEGPGRSGQVQDVALVVGSLFAAVAGSVVTAVVGSAVFGLSLKTDATHQPSLAVLALGQVGLWGGLVGGPALAARQWGTKLREFVGFRFRPVDLCWLALGPVLQVLIGWAYSPFVSSKELSKTATDLASRANGQVIPFALLAAATVIGAPLVEETFFRGFFLGAFHRAHSAWVRRPWVGIAATSVVFGVFHFQPLLTPALIFFGAVAAALSHFFQRLGPSICLHIGFNGFTMIVLGLDVFR